MPGRTQPPSSSSPASQGQGLPQGTPTTGPAGDGQWVETPQGQDTAAPAPSAVNVAWAEPVDTAQSVGQIPENRAKDRKRRAEKSEATPVPKEEQEIPEKTLSQERALTSFQTFYGTVVPYAEANVQSKQGGTITLLKGKEGDLVTQGEVIVRFDERDTRLQLQQALASKNSAVQQVNQAASNFQTVQANLKRYQELFAGGFVSKQQVDDLQNQLVSATSSLNSARENVTQNELQIELIENTLRDFQVKAPISGIVNLKNYHLSELYQGGVIYHLIDIKQVYVEVEVPETYLRQLREGMTVSVVFDAVGEQSFSGTLETILPSGTTDNRNFTAKVLVQNPELKIKPGMFARVEINDGSNI